MVKSSENKVVFSDPETFEISYNDEDLTFEGGEGNATFYYKSEFARFTIGSDAEVTGKDEIKGKSLQLMAGSDSKVSLKFNVEELQVTAGSDSKIFLSGKTNKMSATIGSDCQFSAKDLSAEDVSINLGSDAQGTMRATGIVNAAVGSDASLAIHGNPKKVNEVKSDDAKIILVK